MNPIKSADQVNYIISKDNKFVKVSPFTAIKSGSNVINLDNVKDKSLIELIKSRGRPTVHNEHILIHLHCVSDSNLELKLLTHNDNLNSLTKLNYDFKQSNYGITSLNAYVLKLPVGKSRIFVSCGDSIVKEHKLIVASQNAILEKIYVPGYDKDPILREETIYNDCLFALNTIANIPVHKKGYWIEINVLDSIMIDDRYNKKLGAIGPVRSSLDRRLCHELSDEPWHVSRLNGQQLPDVLKLDSNEFSDIILCRIGPGNYVTAFRHIDDYDYKITIDQLRSSSIFKKSPLHHFKIKEDFKIDESDDFQCTLSKYDNDKIIYEEIVTVKAAECLKLTGSWKDINFVVSTIENINLNQDINYVIIDQSSHGISKKTIINLSAGNYIITIDECCLQIGDEYVGDLIISYVDDNQRIAKNFTKFGKFVDEQQAKEMATNASIIINHNGGEMSIELLEPALERVSGLIRLSIRRENKSLTTKQIVNVEDYRLHYKQLFWINSELLKGNLNKHVISLCDQDYIITLPIIPGQSHFKGNTLLVWPTLDGKELLAIPKSGYANFNRDDELQKVLIQKLPDDFQASLILFSTI